MDFPTLIVLAIVGVCFVGAIAFICKNGGFGGECSGDCSSCTARCQAQKSGREQQNNS